MLTWEAEHAVADYIAQSNGNGYSIVRAEFTLTVARKSSRKHRRQVRKWIYSAPDYGLRIQATRPLFGRTWTIRVDGWGGGVCRWLWMGGDL